jgi:hypothetical protein
MVILPKIDNVWQLLSYYGASSQFQPNHKIVEEAWINYKFQPPFFQWIKFMNPYALYGFGYWGGWMDVLQPCLH